MKHIIEAVEQQYLTKRQARVYSGLSERMLDYAREKDELPSYKVGKRVLFKRTDLDAYVERHRVGVDLNRIVDEVVAEVVGK
jgi:excisionase family DNA binding protein